LYVQETKTLNAEEKLGKIGDLLSIIKTPEEKRVVIAALGAIPTAAALDRLITFANDSTVSEESAQGLLKIATDRNVKDIPTDARRKALQTVVDKSTNDASKKKAEEALRRLR